MTTKTSPLLAWDVASPVTSLDTYIAQVQTFPCLTESEELELATRWHNTGDLAAARALVLSHLRYVVKLARGYRGYGLPEGDLIQEGNVGLMKAVKRFNPTVGVRLATFAIHWIKAEIHDFVIKNFRLIKMATTKAQRKLFFNLNKLKQKAGLLSSEEQQAIAQQLDVSVQDVAQMESRFLHADLSLDADPENEESGYHPPQLADPQTDPSTMYAQIQWEMRQSEQLETGLSSLPERERDIVYARWLAPEKATLQELASKWGVSMERVRQLENQALKRLRKAFDAPGAHRLA